MLKILKNFVTLLKPHIYIDKHYNILIRKISFSGFVALDRDADYWWIADSNQRHYATYKSTSEATTRYLRYIGNSKLKGTVIPLPKA